MTTAVTVRTRNVVQVYTPAALVPANLASSLGATRSTAVSMTKATAPAAAPRESGTEHGARVYVDAVDTGAPAPSGDLLVEALA